MDREVSLDLRLGDGKHRATEFAAVGWRCGAGRDGEGGDSFLCGGGDCVAAR